LDWSKTVPKEERRVKKKENVKILQVPSLSLFSEFTLLDQVA
jgi:hypothetical protein